MNLQRAYALLALFYTALLAIGVLAVVMGGGTPLSLVQLAIGAVAVIGLWGYCLGRQAMNRRTWRPFSGVLVASIAASVGWLATMAPSSIELTWLLTGIIFTTLPALLLFRYGDRDQDLWATPGELAGGQALGELLEQQREVTLETHDAPRPASVHLSRDGERYLARVVRGRGEAAERFEERFARPATLAFFIEAFTGIDVQDGVARYREGAQTARGASGESAGDDSATAPG
ncbi:hypothetical protein [Halomonas borealis]|uniref:hypothetical protein n=1 Tax=Halomonas borealis TaxID=2508710 RepID=UPI00197A9385|nr:hypothetical protein [Halomonas borealis]